MLESLLKKLDRPTCSVTNQKNGTISFVRNATYFEKYVLNSTKDVLFFVPDYLRNQYKLPSHIKVIYSNNPEYEFTIYHNKYYKNFIAKEPIIGKNCKIHDTVIMNVEGLKVINKPDGTKIQFIHTGNIFIGDEVEFGPYSVIHRATIDTTYIGNGVKAGAFTNIGHNNNIGDNTIMAANVVISGSVTVGKNCWLGSGVLIKHGTKICDNVVIGMGALVTKNILEPGIYFGSPAKKISEVREGWNF